MKLFIGCASSYDIPKKYFDDSLDYIDGLLKDNDLIFGTWDSGLMMECYKTAKKYNHNVIGVCPKASKDDFKKLNCDSEVLTNTIEERTDYLINDSDAIVFLPGGIGTIHELFTAIDSKRSGEINKPIIIYNKSHYFDKLLLFLDKLYGEKFSSENVKDCYYVTESLKDTLLHLKNINN